MSEPTDFVIAHHLSEGSGTTAANSGSAGSGWNLAADGTITWVAGPGGGNVATANAVNFSGSAHLETGTGLTRPFSGNSCSLVALARFDGSGQQTVAILGTFNDGIYIQPWNNGRLYGGYSVGSNFTEIGANYTSLVNDGKYHKIIVTIDDEGSRNRVRLYIDDVLVGSTTSSSDVPATLDRFCIGASSITGAHRLTGRVAGTRFYNYVLTSDERADQFTADGGTALGHDLEFTSEVDGGGLVQINPPPDFPYGEHIIVIEIQVNGVWTEITDRVYREGPFTITRGMKSEADSIDPSSVRLLLNNEDGRFTVDNPRSPYYPHLQRNTPLRIGVLFQASRYDRFYGEVSEWPPRWNTPGTDKWVPIEANGITRRLGAAYGPLMSAMKRALIDLPDLVAYWPCEDEDGSTQIASAIPNGLPMHFADEVNFGAYDGFDCSAPIPSFQNTEWIGRLNRHYTRTGKQQLRFLLHLTERSQPGQDALVQLYTTGTAIRWAVRYTDPDGGTISLHAFDEEETGTDILTSGPKITGMNNRDYYVSLELEQVGANIAWRLALIVLRGGGGVQQVNGVRSNYTIGRPHRVRVNAAGGHMDDTAVGHITVQNQITPIDEVGAALEGFAGETAGRRIERLCAKQGVAFSSVGDLDDTALMGPQRIATFLDNIQDAADVDMGLLYEPRDFLGLAYRTRESLYNQMALVEFDYDQGHLSPPLEPFNDDLNVRNDVTVSKDRGSSYRAVLETGVLSIAEPPVGIGRYDEAIQLNAFRDSQLPDLAGWYLHLRTVRGTRYPVITVDLSTPVVAENLAYVLMTADLGDLLTIDHTLDWMPPEEVRQLLRGYSEVIGIVEHEMSLNSIPATPWTIATYGVSRYGSAGTTLGSDIDTTATSLSFSTPVGPNWTTVSGHYPLDIVIGGEQMTITAMSGSGTSQTATVIRSVNGIVKSHSAGAKVDLRQPAIRRL